MRHNDSITRQTTAEKRMRSILLVALILATLSPLASAKGEHDASTIARGRYVVSISGCNDCHTAGYASGGAKTPESDWLQGDTLGYSGPWGTTYPGNLRLRLADMDLATWKAFARTAKLRPPMPYWALNQMTDDDLEAIWAFTRSLGKAGVPAPAALPPGVEAPLPAFTLHLPAPPAAK
jgi:mono/diheme cytochrome c family protein